MPFIHVLNMITPQGRVKQKQQLRAAEGSREKAEGKVRRRLDLKPVKIAL